MTPSCLCGEKHNASRRQPVQPHDHVDRALVQVYVIPVVIIPEGGLDYPEGDVLFEKFIGHIYIEVFSAVALDFAAVVA